MIKKPNFWMLAPIAASLLFHVADTAHAQDTAAVTEGAPATNASSDFVEAGMGLAGVPDITSTEAEERISIDLRDVELRDVVMLFSRMDGVNLIASTSNLNLLVSAKLDDVEWKPALSSILSVHNMTLKESPPGSAVYQIVDRAPDAPEPLVVETIFLQYATVDEVAPVLRTMLPGGSQLSTFASRNALVLRSTALNIAEVMSIIKHLDIQQRQVCVEAQFFELNDEASKQLGIRWDGLEEFRISGQAGPFTWTDELTRERTASDTFNRSDTREQTDLVSKFYDIDDRAFQDEDLSFIEDPVTGVSFAQVKVTPTRETTDSIDLTQAAVADVSDAFVQTISQNKAAILDIDGFDMVISALKRTDGVTVVSNPKIVVASGQTNAFFSVGNREPIIRKTIKRGTVDSPGDEILANLDTTISTDSIRGGYLSTGIELSVLPTVKTDELIEAAITPSLRRKLGDKTVEGNSWPIISVKEIMTRFTLRSGQTVAIGGLTDTSTDKQVSSIPVLGAIPLIGKYLFSHEKDVQTQSETIIFVTLTLADPGMIESNAGVPRRTELLHETLDRMDKRERMLEQRREALKEAPENTDDVQLGSEPRGLIPALFRE